MSGRFDHVFAAFSMPDGAAMELSDISRLIAEQQIEFVRFEQSDTQALLAS